MSAILYKYGHYEYSVVILHGTVFIPILITEIGVDNVKQLLDGISMLNPITTRPILGR